MNNSIIKLSGYLYLATVVERSLLAISITVNRLYQRGLTSQDPIENLVDIMGYSIGLLFAPAIVVIEDFRMLKRIYL